jgi:hypothetical protein
MRAGYKAYEYNRLREKERIAKEGIAKYCKWVIKGLWPL